MPSVRRRKRPREKGRPARKSVPEMVGECQFSAPRHGQGVVADQRLCPVVTGPSSWCGTTEPRGESSVRGFGEQYISGNNGGYLRNELSRSLVLPAICGDSPCSGCTGRRPVALLTAMTRTRPARCGVVLPGSAPPVAMFPVRSLPDCLWFTRTGLPLTISRFTGALPSRFKGLLP